MSDGNQGGQQQGNEGGGGQQQQQQQAWHTGIETETVGWWQNKGYDLSDPKSFATKITENYRNLEKMLGGDREQLISMPKADAPPEEIKAYRMRLGMPAEAKDYDFTAIKGADGNPIPQALSDTLRNSAHAAGLSKDAATAIAAAVQKHIDDGKAAEAATTAGKIAEEKAKLAQSWGANKDFNHLKAMEGARRLGITPEAVQALEGQIGYAAVMETMRKIGVGTSEDTFVERGTNQNGQVTTREGAVARKAELEADAAWVGRYLKGGLAEKREMDALIQMIDGEARAA